ncbi:MAG: 30S ribosomal protein S16 [Patescibacteria group bacterium]|nr:30S ribosomal protein S16 [Patescibacteria group bacterium]
MLRIKLVKTGKKNAPTWRVVVVEKTKTGKGDVSDYIGNYNPHTKPKQFKLDLEKYEKWVKSGAQPTDSVKRLKGNFIDKNKEYQKEVMAKVYKKKKPEETKKQENNKAIKQEEGAGEIVEEVKAEAPTEEVVEEKAEEKNE